MLLQQGNLDAGRPVKRIHAVNELRPVLGPWALLCLGVGAIIGAGIFIIPGPAAAQFAGPAIVFSFVIAAVGCGLSGLCYAELASMYPLAGSAYSYTSRAFGRLAGWVVGWLLILEYLFAAAIVTQGFASYAIGLLPIANSESHHVLISMLLSLTVVLVVTYLAVRGVEFSARVNSVIVVTKVTVILAVIFFGIRYVNPQHWSPFLPPNSGRWGEYGWSGVVRAAGIVFYAYLGFDIVSVSAQEARRPQRDVPLALLGSLVVCTLLFVPMMLVVTGLVDYHRLNVANPVAVALESAGGDLSWLVPVVRSGAMISMVSVLLVILMGQARIVYAMARDGLLPDALARLHTQWKTPAIATFAGASIATGLTVTIPISLLGQLVSVGVLSAFVAVALGVLVLRRRLPSAPRPFRTPLVPWVPLGAILVCGYMAIGLPALTWLRLGIWLLLGAIIYIAYGRHHYSAQAPLDAVEHLRTDAR